MKTLKRIDARSASSFLTNEGMGQIIGGGYCPECYELFVECDCPCRICGEVKDCICICSICRNQIDSCICT